MERFFDSFDRPFVFIASRAFAALPDGVCLVFLSGENLRTTADLMNSFAVAFGFPDYFGRNWNALYDCLVDLDWLPPAGYAVVISGANAILVDEPSHPEFEEPSDLAVLLDLLHRVSEEWNTPVAEGEPWDRPGIPFHVVFEVESDQIGVLQSRIAFAGRAVPIVAAGI
jgi:hypothetical protein